MFCEKAVSQVLAAAHALALDHGAKPLSRVLKMSTTMVSNRFNPATETHQLGLAHAVQVTQETGDTRILVEFARVCGFRLEPIEAQPVNQSEVLKTVLQLESTKGELSSGLMAALADGVISPREELELAGKVNELQDLVNKLALRQGTVE